MKRSISVLFVLFLATLHLQAVAAESGTTTGAASFNAKGDVKNYKPGVMLWSGTFVGVSITESKKGPLHNSGWDCTGESAIQDGNVFRSGGFCLVTDPDGDTINLLWERTDVPGLPADAKTKGIYLSGTGKYNGIKGYYTFACRQGGLSCSITTGEYKIP